MSEQRDLARVLRIRSEAIKLTARNSYDHALREVMYQTAFAFDEAADEITRLRFELASLKVKDHTK